MIFLFWEHCLDNPRSKASLSLPVSVFFAFYGHDWFLFAIVSTRNHMDTALCAGVGFTWYSTYLCTAVARLLPRTSIYIKQSNTLREWKSTFLYARFYLFPIYFFQKRTVMHFSRSVSRLNKNIYDLFNQLIQILGSKYFAMSKIYDST